MNLVTLYKNPIRYEDIKEGQKVILIGYTNLFYEMDQQIEKIPLGSILIADAYEHNCKGDGIDTYSCSYLEQCTARGVDIYMWEDTVPGVKTGFRKGIWTCHGIFKTIDGRLII